MRGIEWNRIDGRLGRVPPLQGGEECFGEMATQGFTLGYHMTGFQPSGAAAPTRRNATARGKRPGNPSRRPSPALKGRHVKARGEAPGNTTPTTSQALKGRRNHRGRAPVGLTPSGRGEYDCGTPTQGFTLGYHMTGFQPSGTTAPAGRGVATRRRSPVNPTPRPSPALKGRHVTARGGAPGMRPPICIPKPCRGDATPPRQTRPMRDAGSTEMVETMKGLLA